MSASQQPAIQPPIKGIVKQVLSGDTVVIRGIPKGGPPDQLTISLSSITAPKLARRAQGQNPETPDEPYAWEAREFLRKKLIGQAVCYTLEKTSNGTRKYGTIYLGQDMATAENINELMVREGLVNIRGERSAGEEAQRLKALHEEAKSLRKGKFEENNNPQDHIRNITWTISDMMNFVEKHNGKRLTAVIENVRDGSTVRAFLLPDFVYITLMMSGIRSPPVKTETDGKVDSTVEYEAKYFTECRLLQQDVEIVLDSVNGANFVGTIYHPKGSIAEELLKAGFAHCVDWSLNRMKKADADRLRQAERSAKESRLRIWKDWTPPPQISDKEFVGTVIEVINGDALMVKLPNGTVKKIFLASIRPPREQNAPPPDENGPKVPPKGKRLLYDIPWLFEAREFLRKKLIGKKVNVTVDYIQQARDSYPEKCCCTVTIANVNVAEAMVSKGLATVVRYRQNDDQRASAYDSLLNAENKAIKSQKGVHAKKDIPTHRVNDYSGESSKAKNLFPHLNRQSRIEAVVEFVASGSRLRLFLPKDSSLITFLLSGIEARHSEGDGVNNEETALQFTRERCMQRDVEIRVENTDRAGNFIGWLWVDNINLSVALVEHGLAKIHFSGEMSEFSRQLINAKNTAKAKGLWKYVEKEEPKEVIEDDRVVERRVDYKEVAVIVSKETSFSCQYKSHASKLDALQAKLAQEMSTNPPLPGAYNPKKGDMCAAKFLDGEWYRAKVEKVSGSKVSVYYVDYGNRQDTQSIHCASLPASFCAEKPFAYTFNLACVQLPKDVDYRREAETQLEIELVNKVFLMNNEYVLNGVSHVTLVDPATKEDVGKKLISEGLLLVDKRRDKKLQKLVSEYNAAEEEAKRNRKMIWEYGDIRDDDDKEFGLGR